MKKLISIITSAPIQYSFNNMDVYDSFDLVSRGMAEAPLRPDALQVIKAHKFSFSLESIKIIFTAESGQSVATAELLINSGLTPNAKIIRTPLLNGINFSMNDLISKEEFIRLPSELSLSIAREIFLTKLFNNKFNESFEELITRMGEFTSFARKIEEPVLCISHSFFIKLLEIYINHNLHLKRLDLLTEDFNPKIKPYEPLTGFTF